MRAIQVACSQPASTTPSVVSMRSASCVRSVRRSSAGQTRVRAGELCGNRASVRSRVRRRRRTAPASVVARANPAVNGVPARAGLRHLLPHSVERCRRAGGEQHRNAEQQHGAQELAPPLAPPERRGGRSSSLLLHLGVELCQLDLRAAAGRSLRRGLGGFQPGLVLMVERGRTPLLPPGRRATPIVRSSRGGPSHPTV